MELNWLKCIVSHSWYQLNLLLYHAKQFCRETNVVCSSLLAHAFLEVVSKISIRNYRIVVGLLQVCLHCIHFSGDCCSRATVIGACLGAKFGIEGIPIEWIDRVDGIEDLIAKSIKVFS